MSGAIRILGADLTLHPESKPRLSQSLPICSAPSKPSDVFGSSSSSLLSLAFQWRTIPKHSVLRRATASLNKDSEQRCRQSFDAVNPSWEIKKKWISDKIQAGRAWLREGSRLRFVPIRFILVLGKDRVHLAFHQQNDHFVLYVIFKKFLQQSFPHFLREGILCPKYCTQSF